MPEPRRLYTEMGGVLQMGSSLPDRRAAALLTTNSRMELFPGLDRNQEARGRDFIDMLASWLFRKPDLPLSVQREIRSRAVGNR
jgi:hypothetical protein